MAQPRLSGPRVTLWRTVLHSSPPPEARACAWLQDDAFLVADSRGHLAVHSVGTLERLAEAAFPGPVTNLAPGISAAEPTGIIDGEPCFVRWNGRRRLALARLGRPDSGNTSLVTVDPQSGDLVAVAESGRVFRRGSVGTWDLTHDLGARPVAAAVDGETMVAGLGSGVVALVVAGRRIDIPAHGDQVTSLIAADDGRFISGSRDGTVALWEHRSGKANELWRAVLPGNHFVNIVSTFFGNLLAASASGVVTEIDADGEILSSTQVHQDSIRTLVSHPTAALVLTASDDAEVSLTDFATTGPAGYSTRNLIPPVGYTRAATLAASQSGGEYIVLGDSQGTLTRLSVEGDDELQSRPGEGGVRDLDSSGVAILVGRETGTVESLPSWTADADWTVNLTEPIFSVALDDSEDGHCLVGTRTGVLAEVLSGVVRSQSRRHSSVLGEIRFHGNALLTCSDDRLLHATHRKTGTRLFDYSADGLALNNILAHSSGDLFVTSDDGSVHQLSGSGQLVQIWRLHDAPVRAIAELDQGSIATGDRDGWVKLWSPAQQKELAAMRFSKRVIALPRPKTTAGMMVVTENEVSAVEVDIMGPDPARLSTHVDSPRLVVESTRRLAANQSIGHILHLSDTHFHGNEDPQSWVSPLVEDLRRELNVASLELIVLSGDVANTGQQSEFDKAAEFVELLRNEMGGPKVLIVPGNHDMDWAVSRTSYRPVRKSEMPVDVAPDAIYDPGGSYVEIASPKDLEGRFSAFGQFHRRVTTQEYPLDPNLQFTSVMLATRGVAVYGLNSNFRIDHHHPARAAISTSALGRLLASIRRERADGHGWFRIAVWHHPIDASVGEATANPEVADQLSKAGFRMLLHGHIHRPTRAVRPYDTTGPRGIVTVGSGTFGALSHEWTPGFPLGYNVLSVFHDRVTVSSRRRESPYGPWSPDARWLKGPGEDPSSSYTVWRNPE